MFCTCQWASMLTGSHLQKISPDAQQAGHAVLASIYIVVQNDPGRTTVASSLKKSHVVGSG